MHRARPAACPAADRATRAGSAGFPGLTTVLRMPSDPALSLALNPTANQPPPDRLAGTTIQASPGCQARCPRRPRQRRARRPGDLGSSRRPSGYPLSRAAPTIAPWRPVAPAQPPEPADPVPGQNLPDRPACPRDRWMPCARDVDARSALPPVHYARLAMFWRDGSHALGLAEDHHPRAAHFTRGNQESARPGRRS